MSRHDPHADDFSFLPTVDDTEALDAQELWSRARAHQGVEGTDEETETEVGHDAAEAPTGHDYSYTVDEENPESTDTGWDATVQAAYFQPTDEGGGMEDEWQEAEAGGYEEHVTAQAAHEYVVDDPAIAPVDAPDELIAEWGSLDDDEAPAFIEVAEPEPVRRSKAPPMPVPCESVPTPRSKPVEAPRQVFEADEDALESHALIQDQDADLDIPAAVVLGLGASNGVEPEAADVSAELAKAKRSALMVALTTVGGLMLLLMLIRIAVPEIPAAEITAYSSADATTESESLKKIASAAPQTSPMAASLMPIAAAGVSDIAIPQVDITTSSADLNIGSSMGSFSGGVSSGTAGGTITFMGNRGTGRRIVYVVDVSSSMSARGSGEGAGITRFELLKRELSRSVTGMPAGAQYQVIFFSDFAWAHNEVDSTKPAELQKAFWEISSETVASARIPHTRYITANLNTLRRSKDIVNAADNPGGTNWGSGLIMALSMRPAPDVIFFMTDGNRNDESGWIDAVTAFNAKQGGRTVIHTTAMMDPDAATELNQMASNNRGKFSVVLGNGKVLKGEDWFKGVRQ